MFVCSFVFGVLFVCLLVGVFFFNSLLVDAIIRSVFVDLQGEGHTAICGCRLIHWLLQPANGGQGRVDSRSTDT